MDKFNHFSFLAWFQFLFKIIVGQQYYRIMYIKRETNVLVYKANKTKIEQKSARKYLGFLWF
jgi:hypothetical protein